MSSSLTSPTNGKTGISPVFLLQDLLANQASDPYCFGMRITLDARMMGPENTRGIGRYVEQLVRAMLEVAPGNQYVLIVRQPNHPFADHPSVETVVADIPWYGLREQREMTSVIAKTKPDVVHVPHWNVPTRVHNNLVITIHDLLLRHEPESAKISTRGPLLRLAKRAGYRVVLSQALRHANRILVPTHFVEQDVQTLYPATKGKLVVTGEGMPMLDVASWNPSDPPFLLYVGSAYPHKGLADVFDAWPKISRDFPSLRFKVAGEMDVFMSRLKERTTHEPLANIAFLGRVSDDELVKLYRTASAFIFPSHFEGFGLPPLEAIAHGCPVIAADAPATVEVLGKSAATIFRRGDVDAILGAVHQVLERRDEAHQKGLHAAPELARQHDWKRTAERTLQAYLETR
ncbi:MAG: glycosyltransferase family 1 protein [Patescibacteria group bacterium]